MTSFVTDTFAGITVGNPLGGTTASDGSSVWTAVAGNFTKAASGIWPTNNGSLDYMEVRNNVAPSQNVTLTWDMTFVGTGGIGAGWQIGVWAKSNAAQNHQGLRMRINDGGGANESITLEETNDFGGYSNAVNGTVIINTGVLHFTLTASKGSATLSWTGGATGSLTLTNCSMTAGSIDYVGLYGYNPVSGGMTGTNYFAISNFVASNVVSSPTAYALVPAVDIYSGVINYTVASKYPTGFNIVNQGVGYAGNNNGYKGGRQLTLALDGVFGSSFTWTPPAGYTVQDSTGTSQSAITIAAGQSASRFTLIQPAGILTASPVLQGTNNQSLANATLTLATKNKIFLIEGDSISDVPFGSNWLASVKTAIGSAWVAQSSAVAYSQLDDGTNFPDTNILKRSVITTNPFHDSARTQEALLFWGGTNDLFGGGKSAAQTYASLQSIIAASKAAGWKNIAIGTVIDRSGYGPGNAAWTTLITTYNNLVKSGFGSTGTDTSVTVLDFAANSNLGATGAAANTSYFPDGTHPFGTAAATIISGLVSTWVNGLPASQSLAAGVLSVTSIGTGIANLSCTAPANGAGTVTYQLFRNYQAGGLGSAVSGKSGTWTSGAITLQDTSRDAATYWYTLEFYDTGNGGHTVDSNQVQVAIANGNTSSGSFNILGNNFIRGN